MGENPLTITGVMKKAYSTMKFIPSNLTIIIIFIHFTIISSFFIRMVYSSRTSFALELFDQPLTAFPYSKSHHLARFHNYINSETPLKFFPLFHMQAQKEVKITPYHRQLYSILLSNLADLWQ